MNRAPRSTRAEIAEAEAAQSRVIAALREAGEIAIADRLLQCQQARAARRGGGWPWRCRSAGGCWSCRRPVLRRWWLGLRHWISALNTDASLVILPLPVGHGVRAAVQALRRTLRDLRDRAARGRGGWHWRGVAFAGLALGDGTVWLAVAHNGITRAALADRFKRRFGRVAASDFGDAPPPTSFPVGAAAELAVLQRGIEALRVVVAPQRVGAISPRKTLEAAEPMPVVFA